MVVLKCKMCGGNLEAHEGMTVCECEYCGSTQTVPRLDDEKKINLFMRANRLRQVNEFDKASGVYESIVSEFPEEAEAYWGLVLCKYGIEYVDDPRTGKKIPTCHRSSFESIMDDQNFEMVMEYSDTLSRSVYRDEAKAIEQLRIGIIEVSTREEPYDIFICYKETDEKGNRTIDSVIAQDVYDALVEKGYKVFFSRITLEDKLGQEYEPYIFAALNSAKVMLAFGTDYEYYNAVWVKNEWSRFLSLIAKGEKKTLIPCYKDIDAYDMPKEFARLQAQDMGKIGAIQDLLRGISKIIGGKEENVSVRVGGDTDPNASALVQRGNMALEDGEFEKAEVFFERALDSNPSEARAYLGKFLSSYHLTSLSDLEEKVCILENDKDLKRAERFADPSLRKVLGAIIESNEAKIQRLRIIDALKKVRDIKFMAYLEDKEREAYEILMTGNPLLEDNARDIYSLLCSEGYISTERKSKYIERMPIVQGIANDLKDYEKHGWSALRNAEPLCNYPGGDITNVINDLVKYGLVEEHEGYEYSLAGALEKKKAFDAAYAEIKHNYEEALEMAILPIEERHKARIEAINSELNREVYDRNRQHEDMLNKISSLRNEQASLGLFKGKQKRNLQEQIDNVQHQLSSLPQQQDIESKYQTRIKQADAEKDLEIDKLKADMRGRFIWPKLEDFINA